MHDQLIEAVERAAEYGAPPRTWNVSPNAVFQLAEGAGHLLTEATITEWQLDR
ncbi:hypothetical protein LK459_17610 [Gordonia otitidis]|uniref:hypothetical protein n=1 Tax=Gordonia otitidis TaxID=249058 RepID=UPI001D1548AF|nr:hypothetical protein [Gordonia otitidis]UEA58380.1 hypothetical protein LK459_17610 [Gordonia otitidis]